MQLLKQINLVTELSEPLEGWMVRTLSRKHNTPTPWYKNEVVTLLNDHFTTDFELIKPQDPVT